MSYYPHQQQQHQPPPPPRAPQQQQQQSSYLDQHNHYQQQPTQNGGYQQQQQQQQHHALYDQQQAYQPYPTRPSYGQYHSDSAVQQPQGSYAYQDQNGQSPRNASYSEFSSPQPPQQQYNPGDYSQSAQPSPQTQAQSYNPAAYAGFNQPSYAQSQQYYPASYGEAPFRNNSGPVDPYDYASASSASNYSSPAAYSQSEFSPHLQQYAPSPHQQPYSPHQPQYLSQPPAHPHGHPTSQNSPPTHSSPYVYQNQVQTTPYPPDPFRRHAGSIHGQRPPTNIPDSPWAHSPPISQSHRRSPSSQVSSPPSTTPGPTPPIHATNRSTPRERHPHDRPLPPQPSDQDSDYFPDSSPRYDDLGLAQDVLFSEVEDALRNAGRSPSISVDRAPFQPPVHASSTTVNGALSPGLPQSGHQGAYSSDSDAEAAQGLAMMRAAEEDDARRQSSGDQSRFTGLGSPERSRQEQRPEGSDSDDYGNIDMTSFGGGYEVRMTYGGNPNQLAAGGDLNHETFSPPISSQHSSMRRSHASQSSQLSRASYDYRSDSIHPFPNYNPAARVEVGGTGGLSEPTGLTRRQSYDEGDDSLIGGQLPDRFPDEPPDIFFQPAITSYPSRPLPVPPYPESDTPPSGVDSNTLPPVPPYPNTPNEYTVNAQGQVVPRSTSLISHSNTPQVIQPLRSKTDAEERKLRQQLRTSVYSTVDASSGNGSVVMDLPAIGKRFAPSKLGAPDFKKCAEPWSLMSLMKWLIQVTNPELNTDLREGEIKEALVALFTNKVPTMNIADAETLSSRVVTDMYEAGTLVATEEWVKIVPGFISGVIFQLTQSGCYSPTVHNHIIPNMRCYSRLCQRTLKKVNLKTAPVRSTETWIQFYHLTKENLEGKDKKDIERQFNLHEIVTSEELYMDSLDVLRALFRDPLATGEPSVIAPKRKERFIRDVFGRLEAVKLANEEHLLPQLKYRQQEQGPWIVGFSDIFRQWVRKAKSAYVEYANDFPKADYIVRQELDRNIEFRNYVDRARADKRSNRLSMDNFLKAPIQRLQRYALLLSTVLRNMKSDSQEKDNLKLALDEVKAVAHECDARVAEQQRKIDLTDLGARLVLRPGMEKEVELNLEHFGRRLIHRGDLQRTGSNRFTWLECHALLFDHYLILAKTVAQRIGDGGRLERYDVSKLPIPMDLLTLEGTNDPPVQKSSYIKGITSVREATGRSSTPADTSALGRTSSNQSPGPQNLQHSNTATSANSLTTVSSLGEGKDSERILYPFRIKHLGRDSYTLFALTDQARKDWISKIVEAKTKHAAALHAQNAEPFRLRVMADSAFVFDAFGSNGRGVVIKGTPVDRAISEVEHRFKDTGRPAPICRARVNCAASFSMPYLGKQMVAIGTDYGVYVSEQNNPRGWTKAINMSRVTQVAVLEEFNLFLLISDKSLIAYHLDVVCPNERNGTASTSDSIRKAPLKLSGSRDVGFFATGKMKDRTLVFYKKRESLTSVFKILEPVYQKSSEKKRTGLFKRGNTEFFREYDEFYIPTECTGINLFQSSLAVGTARGFEILTLDKKQAFTVPELKEEHVQNIAQHIKDQRALSMLRLSEQEFLLVYANCAVYVNKHGDVSRSVVMEFVGSALHAAALYGPYLVLFNDDFVEIRNAQNGRLKQIIAGREIKCLDDGTNWSANGSTSTPATTMAAGNGNVNPAGGPAPAYAPASRTLKLVMQHPEMEKNQIVVELLLNENTKE